MHKLDRKQMLKFNRAYCYVAKSCSVLDTETMLQEVNIDISKRVANKQDG